MARKVFVSYKYNDPYVYKIGNLGTCRDYVDVTMNLLEDVHIYKGEEDGNDLSQFKDETIRTHLKDKIRDSSVTVVFVSQGMKSYETEEDQWIPWEVSYSLREKNFEGRTSLPNGLLAVIIPDQFGTYNNYFEYSNCNICNVRTHKTQNLFSILRNNMFNRKTPITQSCTSLYHPSTYHVGDDHSYISQVTWNEFITNPSLYIERAISLRDRIDEFNIQKVII